MKALYRALALVLISYGLARAQTVSPPNTGGGGGGVGCTVSGSAGQLVVNDGSTGCSSVADYVFTTHTLAAGAAGILDLHNAATSALKVPGGFATGLLHVTTTTGATIGGLLVNADITNATIDLTAKVTGLLPSANGGTGVNNTATLTLGSSNQNWASLGTGIVKNTTTTGALSLATSGDILGLCTTCVVASSPGVGLAHFAGSTQTATSSLVVNADITAATIVATTKLSATGTKNSTTFLRGDDTWAAPAGTGTVTVVGAGNLTSTALVTGGGSQTLQTPASTATMDSSGNIATPGTLSSGVGSGVAGGYQCLQGTASTGPANSVILQCPTSVTTAYTMSFPVAAGTGFVLNTDTSNVDAWTFVGFSGTGNVMRVASPTSTGTFTAATLVATTFNGNTFTTGTGVLTIGAGKTFTSNNTLTITATDGITMTTPTTSFTAARTDAANTFTGTQTIGALVATTFNGNTFTTGTGVLTIAAAKTLTANNSITLAGTDSTTMTFPGTSQTIPGLGQANTWTTGAQDFGGATSLKIPVGAGATTATNGFVAYDSTNNMLHASQSSADAKIPQFTVTPANGDCAKWTVSGSNYKLDTSGGSCGGAGVAGATLFSTTNSTTVTATSATTLIGTVSGSTTVAANTFTAGQLLQIHAHGFYSTPATPASLTIDLKIGGTTRITTGAVVQIASVTNGVWNLDCDVTTRTTGASGTQIANCIFVGTGSTLTPGEAPMFVSSAWTIDTTATEAIDVQATWSTATGSPTITSTNIAAWIPGAPVTSVFTQTGAVGNLTGDVTTTNSTATTIANDAVTTVKILNANVTAAKMVNAGVFTGDATTTFPAITIGAGAITNSKIANSTIDLTAKVTGLLPLANGGTNCAAPYPILAKTTTYQVLATDFTCHATITVASGTFTITLVASGSQPGASDWLRVINYGSGVVTIARSGQNINGGTASYVVESSSATNPSEAFISSDATNYFIGGGFTNPMTTAGDLIISGTTGLPTRLAIGGATTVLHGGATAETFSSVVSADLNITTTTCTAPQVLTAISATGTGTCTAPLLTQNSQSAAYTTVLGDAGKQIYHPGADTTARTFTIDSNANVAYAIGTCISFFNDTSAGTLTIAITSDTMILAGAGTTGSRTLTASNEATACKMTSTRWIISGSSGLT